MKYTQIIDALIKKSQEVDGRNSRLSITEISSAPVQVEDAVRKVATDAVLYFVDGMLWRSSTAFNRYYTIIVKDDAIIDVQEHNTKNHQLFAVIRLEKA